VNSIIKDKEKNSKFFIIRYNKFEKYNLAPLKFFIQDLPWIEMSKWVSTREPT